MRILLIANFLRLRMCINLPKTKKSFQCKKASSVATFRKFCNFPKVSREKHFKQILFISPNLLSCGKPYLKSITYDKWQEFEEDALNVNPDITDCP